MLEANPQNRFGKARLPDERFWVERADRGRGLCALPEKICDPPRIGPQPATEREPRVVPGAPIGMARETGKIGDGGVVSATIAAIRDLRNRKIPDISPLPGDVRIDGKTCLVTGANSGLGRAAAIELARRGGNMILACRPGHAETCDEIRRASGSRSVELIEVDLADLRSCIVSATSFSGAASESTSRFLTPDLCRAGRGRPRKATRSCSRFISLQRG